MDYFGVLFFVISDYEGGRRKSFGVLMIRKFVEVFIEIDEKRGGNVIRVFSKIIEGEFLMDVIFDICEFVVFVLIRVVVEVVKGEVVVNYDFFDRKIYGYMVVDSIWVIFEMSSEEFFKFYGWIIERVLVFIKVIMGRSFMIVVCV